MNESMTPADSAVADTVRRAANDRLAQVLAEGGAKYARHLKTAGKAPPSTLQVEGELLAASGHLLGLILGLQQRVARLEAAPEGFAPPPLGSHKTLEARRRDAQ